MSGRRTRDEFDLPGPDRPEKLVPRAELAELAALGRVSSLQALSPIPDDVPSDIRDFAETLRALFGALGMSLNRLAALVHSDPGTVSRYLRGKRIPPPEFIASLCKAVYDAKGALIAPAVQEFVHEQFLVALREHNPARYEVQRLTDLLEAAAQEKRQYEITVGALEEAIASRNEKIYALELESRQLRSGWAHAEERLDEGISQRERLQQTIDSLYMQVNYFKEQLLTAQRRAAAAEERCRELEARLDAAGALLQDEDQHSAAPQVTASSPDPVGAKALRHAPAGASLARRLRELRTSGVLGTRLTQLQLAQALSEEEPVTASTISSWENVSSPKMPPFSRLSAYARFFATERSLRGTPHLVPFEELTPPEDEARRELEQQLFRLRDESGEPSHGRQFWRFDDGAPITVISANLRKNDEIVLGPLAEEDNPNFTELYSSGDLDAIVDLYGHLRATNPNSSVRLASETTSDLVNHLVALGGIAWNDFTRRLNDMLDLPVRQVQDPAVPSGDIFVTMGNWGDSEAFLPRWQDDNPGTREQPGVLLEDVGMLARLPNPYNRLRTLTYCNGIHSRGVLGAVRCMTDPNVRDDNERYLEETFPESDRFVILMRVPVLGGSTLSPSLKDPATVLFQWPGNPSGN